MFTQTALHVHCVHGYPIPKQSARSARGAATANHGSLRGITPLVVSSPRASFPVRRSCPRRTTSTAQWPTGRGTYCKPLAHSEHRIPASSSKLRASLSGTFLQTPSIAFRHLPPNSAGFSYATEGALFTSAQLSTDAVSAPR